jgi:hypothetical protein
MPEKKNLTNKLPSLRNSDLFLIMAESAKWKYEEIIDGKEPLYQRINSAILSPLEYPVVVLLGYLFKKSFKE